MVPCVGCRAFAAYVVACTPFVRRFCMMSFAGIPGTVSTRKQWSSPVTVVSTVTSYQLCTPQVPELLLRT
eukprot:12151038-Prorocentrum_lima.AAC.1